MQANYMHYFISAEGDVFDVVTGNTICKYIHPTGYYYVQIDTPEGFRNIQLHRIVAIVYIPNPDNLPVVRHKDANKLNCHYTNLTWGTQQDNIYDSIDKIRTKAIQRRKLSDEDITYIRSVFIKGDRQFGCHGLAKKFNVRPQYISSIVNKTSNCTR